MLCLPVTLACLLGVRHPSIRLTRYLCRNRAAGAVTRTAAAAAAAAARMKPGAVAGAAAATATTTATLAAAATATAAAAARTTTTERGSRVRERVAAAPGRRGTWCREERSCLGFTLRGWVINAAPVDVRGLLAAGPLALTVWALT